MIFYKICATCNKNKMFARKRSFLVKKVDTKPITSEGRMCGRCYKKLKQVLKKI